MIQRDARVPLYVQLAELFRQRIAKGVWRHGEKLPSLESLVAEFEVARVTVRQAVDQLTREGLVSPQRGRGTFVTGAPAQDRWLRVETSLKNLADVYRDTQPTILGIDESSHRQPLLDAADGVAAPGYVYMLLSVVMPMYGMRTGRKLKAIEAEMSATSPVQTSIEPIPD